MRDWLATLHEAVARGEGPVVRVVVAVVRGSAPREPGASMLVLGSSPRTQESHPIETMGTIGGGHLELVATRIAQDMLHPGAADTRNDRFPLAASLGQCCGGIVELWFERYGPSDEERLRAALRRRSEGASAASIAAEASRDPRAATYEHFYVETTPLWIFGSGHVGSALARVVTGLPFEVTVVDSRENFVIPGAAVAATARDPITRVHAPDPADEVASMPAGAWALVMTHSHDEDLAICEALLADGRFGWAGVIGSQAKTHRFRQRLGRKFPAEAIARLAMPIGIGGIRSKEPAAIAVAVAAQLLQLREPAAANRGETRSASQP